MICGIGAGDHGRFLDDVCHEHGQELDVLEVVCGAVGAVAALSVTTSCVQ